MAKRFTRSEIRRIVGDACTDEIENELVALHLGVVDPMKDDLDRYKTEADKVEGLEQKIKDLESGEDYKTKYEKERDDFAAYKQSVQSEKDREAKQSAIRDYFSSKGIKGDNLDIALRGAQSEINAAELDGEKIKDTKPFDDLIAGTFKGLVSTSGSKGADVPNPPANNGGKKYNSKEEIMAIQDSKERVTAIAEHHEMFGF